VALVECVATNCFDAPNLIECATAPVNQMGCNASISDPATMDALPIVNCANANCATECGL
jgi:hypothetical protein